MEVKGEEIELMKRVIGVNKVGSGLVDSSFEKGLSELVVSTPSIIENTYP
jgi:hypothetical protein